MLPSYQHSIPPYPALLRDDGGTAVVGCHRRRSRRRCPHLLLSATLVVLVLSVTWRITCSWKQQTAMKSGLSLKVPVLGKAKRVKTQQRNHGTNEAKSSTHTQSYNHDNDKDHDHGQHQQTDDDDDYVVTHKNETHVSLPIDPTNNNTSWKVHHHHKHVNVHVIVDDDDNTVVPLSTTKDDNGNEASVQSSSNNHNDNISSNDWQKCTHSQDPDCWKSLYAPSQKHKKDALTKRPSPSPSAFPPTSPPLPNNLQPSIHDRNIIQPTLRETQAPSVLDWKQLGEELHDRLEKCKQSNDPECWKNIYAPATKSGTSVAPSQQPSSAYVSSNQSLLSPQPSVIVQPISPPLFPQSLPVLHHLSSQFQRTLPVNHLPQAHGVCNHRFVA